jgi:hypothetical protein
MTEKPRTADRLYGGGAARASAPAWGSAAWFTAQVRDFAKKNGGKVSMGGGLELDFSQGQRPATGRAADRLYGGKESP